VLIQPHPHEIYAALNAVRENGRFISLDNYASEIENHLDRAASVESQVKFTQLHYEILNTLSKFSPRQRSVIVQCYYLYMSGYEMALALDAAPGIVKWLLNEGRERLRH